MQWNFDSSAQDRHATSISRCVRGDASSALDHLQHAGALDVDDFFSFRVGEAMMELDGSPYGGARFPVESRIDGRIFVRFHVDVGIGDGIQQLLFRMRQAEVREHTSRCSRSRLPEIGFALGFCSSFQFCLSLWSLSAAMSRCRISSISIFGVPLSFLYSF